MAAEAGSTQAVVDLEPAAEPKSEAIREQMAETRSALAEKLEALEAKVLGTVETAQATVEQTVDVVKETVQGTLATVKRTFDLSYQVEQHPWTMVTASMLAGYAVGHLLGSPHLHQTSVPGMGNGREASSRGPITGAKGLSPQGSDDPRQTRQKSRLRSPIDGVLGKVESVALSAAMGMLRDWLHGEQPRLAPQLEEIVDGVTRKLVGKPVAGQESARPVPELQS
jgi:ElaB/YqjD/DUF883 family membrane-anchored ribosome-binding protein